MAPNLFMLIMKNFILGLSASLPHSNGARKSASDEKRRSTGYAYFIFLAFVFLFVLCQSRSWADQNNEEADEPFVVVELFGSEGCSSCPPADDLLRKLTSLAKTQKKKIFTLSFHVDYWNYLGWVDPFSKKQFTQRQYQYTAIFRKSSAYTPQMIINGAHELVGSDQRLMHKYVDQYLQTAPVNKIILSVGDGDPNQIEVFFECREWMADMVVNVALVESGVESNVIRGENSGRLLKHDHVVREFKTISLSKKDGMVFLAKPKTNDLSRFSIIAYLQNKNDMNITAAESISLSQ